MAMKPLLPTPRQQADFLPFGPLHRQPMGLKHSWSEVGNTSALEAYFHPQRVQMQFGPPSVSMSRMPGGIPLSRYNAPTGPVRSGSFPSRSRSNLTMEVPFQPPPSTFCAHEHSIKGNGIRLPKQSLLQPQPPIPTALVLPQRQTQKPVERTDELLKSRRLSLPPLDCNNNTRKECAANEKSWQINDSLSSTNLSSSNQSLSSVQSTTSSQSEADDFGLRSLATAISHSMSLRDKEVENSNCGKSLRHSNNEISPRSSIAGSSTKESPMKQSSIMTIEELGFNESLVRNFRPVHKYMESPFSNRIVSPFAASCELLPEEYLMSRNMHAIAEKLPAIDSELRYTQTDKLFLFFYLAIGEVLQLNAATQLYQRGWRYIKTSGIWIARIKDHQPDVRTSTYESGTYQYFNIKSWQREHGHFTLAYEELAEGHSMVENINSSLSHTRTTGVLTR